MSCRWRQNKLKKSCSCRQTWWRNSLQCIEI